MPNSDRFYDDLFAEIKEESDEFDRVFGLRMKTAEPVIKPATPVKPAKQETSTLSNTVETSAESQESKSTAASGQPASNQVSFSQTSSMQASTAGRNSSRGHSGDRTLNPKIVFSECAFGNIDALCRAMGSDWENGVQFLMRGDLASRLSTSNGSNVANRRIWLSQVQDVLNSPNYNSPDQRLFRVIHLLSPSPDYIACPLGCFESTEALSKRLSAALQSNNQKLRATAENSVKLLVGSHTLTDFMVRRKVNRSTLEHMSILDETPSNYVSSHLSIVSYEFAFLLSGHAELDVGLPDHTVFNSVDELKNYLASMAHGDYKELYRICEYFLDGAYILKPKVYGWLRSKNADVRNFNT